MTMVDHWPVEVTLHADEWETRAEARLSRDGAQFEGKGLARRNPEDREVTEIGEEIATARALADLAHRLLMAAAGSIEGITHERAHLHL